MLLTIRKIKNQKKIIHLDCNDSNGCNFQLSSTIIPSLKFYKLSEDKYIEIVKDKLVLLFGKSNLTSDILLIFRVSDIDYLSPTILDEIEKHNIMRNFGTKYDKNKKYCLFSFTDNNKINFIYISENKLSHSIINYDSVGRFIINTKKFSFNTDIIYYDCYTCLLKNYRYFNSMKSFVIYDEQYFEQKTTSDNDKFVSKKLISDVNRFFGKKLTKNIVAVRMDEYDVRIFIKSNKTLKYLCQFVDYEPDIDIEIYFNSFEPGLDGTNFKEIVTNLQKFYDLQMFDIFEDLILESTDFNSDINSLDLVKSSL